MHDRFPWAKEKKPAIIFLSVVASYLRRGCNGRNVRRLANIIDRIGGRGRKKVFHSCEWKRAVSPLSTRFHSATNVPLPPTDVTFRSSFASFLVDAFFTRRRPELPISRLTDDLAFELRKTRPSRGSPADIEVSGEEGRGGEKCARSATDGKSRTTKYVIYFEFSGEIAESLAGNFFFIKRGYTIEFRFPSENRLFPSVGKKVRERARNESTKEGGKEVRSKFGRNPNSHPISCRAFTRFFFFI